MDTTLDVYSTIPLPLALSGGHSITALYPATPLDESEQARCNAAPSCVLTEVVIDGDKPTNRVLRMLLDIEADIAAQVSAAMSA